MNCTSKKQFSEIVIVIFLADFNITWRYEMANIIGNTYSNLVNSGTIQVIEAPRAFYPPLENLNHTYNDSEDKKS
jgi:alpha-1,3-mannosylglycoprotein beta-1,4-N-acetylglucosaminyltransferase C